MAKSLFPLFARALRSAVIRVLVKHSYSAENYFNSLSFGHAIMKGSQSEPIGLTECLRVTRTVDNPRNVL